MPYDPLIVGPHSDRESSDLTDQNAEPTTAEGIPSGGSVGMSEPRPSRRWITALAFAVVAIPFAWALLRLLASPTAHLTLPDDLALIDLHVRRALAWKQQLGVFDRNNWNHPGPSYFYLLSLVYRALGSSVRSLFVGATLLNALFAVACVAVVRRRTTPTRALWAAVWVCVLAGVLAAAGPSATTYSESVLGALVSPWNPMVVLFPLLLLVLLSAGAVDRSGPSLVAALLVTTFVIQTDISATPVALAFVGTAAIVWLGTVVADRVGAPRRAPDEPSPHPARSPWTAVMVAAGLVALALMWLPPVIEQFSNHPGNLTLIERFFSTGHAGQNLSGSLWAVAAAAAVVVVGPSEVMGSILGWAPAHAGLAVGVSLTTVAIATVTTVLSARRRARFAIGMGVLTLVGSAAAVVGVTHVVGFIFGYLVVWVVVLPVAALVGVGMVQVPLPASWSRSTALSSTGSSPGSSPGSSTRSPATIIRVGLCAVAVVVAVVTCIRVAAIPPLAHASDPHVGQLADLVTPLLMPGDRVAVGDGGAGTKDTQLLDTEEFIGLVNQLDRLGYHPTVNQFWKSQLGPGYRTDGTETRVVGLTTWTPASPSLPGYVGHVGDMAVTVTDRTGDAVGSAG